VEWYKESTLESSLKYSSFVVFRKFARMVLYPGKTKAQNRIRANSMNRKISQTDIPLLAVDDRVLGGTGATGEGVGSAATGEAVGFNTVEGAAAVGPTTGESVEITATGEAVGVPTTVEGAVDVGLTTGEGVDIEGAADVGPTTGEPVDGLGVAATGEPVGGLDEGASVGAILLL